ncbi:MAG TPA: cyclic 2,3-diphosphoglycerate synthetase, partial [Actinomycetota bacterium]|nr:cyclic 2,3-diphosphoglycerate synthetase [Actinomycetota bacterium]
GYRERMELAAVALVRGVPYVGADFRLDPPPAAGPLPVPAFAVIGTGKRTGKTAIGGTAARVAAARGMDPVVVAMGRGGPEAPEVAHAPIDLQTLRDLVRAGRHAASDYLEDALTANVTTVGARRIGGGLAGAPFATNAAQAADVAVSLGAGIVVLEGSGAALPPVAWDGAALVAPASLDPEYLRGYLGPYRILRSDLFVLTMGSGPDVGPEALSALESHIRRLRPDAWFVVTDFVPTPLGDVEGRRVFLATTASADGARAQAAHLQKEHGARVVATSARLADRAALRADVEAAGPFDVLATELKAAAVEVAAELALERGAGVVFVDNRAVTLSGDGELEDLLGRALELAARRAAERTARRAWGRPGE